MDFYTLAMFCFRQDFIALELLQRQMLLELKMRKQMKIMPKLVNANILAIPHSKMEKKRDRNRTEKNEAKGEKDCLLSNW